MPKVSVIVPVYNAEKYLHRCIDSILAQTFTDFELLLINDGSKDKSGEICDEYASKDERVCVFHKENGGVSSARNLGLDNAKGEWVTFVDSDDWINDNYLVADNFDEDLLLLNWKNVTTNKFDEYFNSALYRDNDLLNFLNINLHLTHLCSPWGKLFRSDIIKEKRILFDSNFSLGEDTLFVMEYLFYVKSIIIISSSVYMHTPNTDSSKYPQRMGISLKYLNKFLFLYRNNGFNNLQLVRMRYEMFKMCTVDNNGSLAKLRWYLNKGIIGILLMLHGINSKTFWKVPFLLLNKIKNKCVCR